MTRKSMLICVLFLVPLMGAYSRQIGEDCAVRKTGRRGTCTTIYSCEHVKSELRAKRRPNYCKTRHSMLGVCCPNTEVNNFKRISERKCAEYTPASNTECKRSVQPSMFIADAEINEFPHMALIGYGETDTEWSCGGSLISEVFVLTAALCEKYDDQKAKYVRLGQIDRSFENSELYNVKRIIVHPRREPPKVYNDIALIELDREVQFKPNIRPACLPKYAGEPVENFIVSGWGATEFGGLPSDRLHKTALEKFSYEECSQEYMDVSVLPNGINTTTQICTGSHTDGRGPCSGDGGGPLQIYHYSRYCMYTVVGIVSFGRPCGLIGVSDVFTQVGAYLSWIEDIVWGEH